MHSGVGDKVKETCVELVHEAFRRMHKGQAGFPLADIDLTCMMCVQITMYRRWRASSRPCRHQVRFPLLSCDDAGFSHPY